MSRKDKQKSQQLSKLGDAVDKGLRRGDAELAASELLRLPRATREPWLGAVATLAASAAEYAHQQKNFAKLHAWAVKITDESRLLPPNAPQRQQMGWSLLWGAVQHRDWQRVSAIRLLVPEVCAPHSAAALSLAQWLDAAGQPEPVNFATKLPVPLLQHLASAMPATAPVKNDDSAWTRPTDLQGAEDAVLFCAASLPWPRFAAVVVNWCQRPPRPLDLAIAKVVARLAVADALRLRAAKRTHWADGLQTLADLAERIAPNPLDEQELFVAVRLTQAALGAGFDVLSEPPAALNAILILTQNNPQMLNLATSLLARADFAALDKLRYTQPESSQARAKCLDAWRKLSERTLAEHHDPTAIWFALQALWRDSDTCRVAFWALQQACKRALAEPTAILASWRALEEPVRVQILAAVSRSLPVDLAAQMYETLWPVADQSDRNCILVGVTWLVEKSSLWIPERKAGVHTAAWRKAAEVGRYELWVDSGEWEALDAAFDQLGYERTTPEDIEELIEKNQPLAAGGKVSPAGRAIWQRFEEKLLQCGPTALQMAYDIAEDWPAKNQLLLRWLDTHRTLEHYNLCIELANSEDDEHFDEFERASVYLLVTDAQGCAALLLEAEARDVSVKTLQTFAGEFLKHLDDHVGQWTADMQAAKVAADKLFAPKVVKKIAAKTPTKGKKPKPGALPF